MSIRELRQRLSFGTWVHGASNEGISALVGDDLIPMIGVLREDLRVEVIGDDELDTDDLHTDMVPRAFFFPDDDDEWPYTEEQAAADAEFFSSVVTAFDVMSERVDRVVWQLQQSLERGETTVPIADILGELRAIQHA